MKNLITSLRNKLKTFKEEEVKKTLIVLIPETISQEDYSTAVYPLIMELYRFNPDKYHLVNHIAEKALQQENYEIFKHNYHDLRSEIKLWI